MAEHCGIAPLTLKVYLMHALDVMSLDQRISGSNDHGDERSTYLELIPDREADETLEVELEMLGAEIDKAITTLTLKQQLVIQRRYGGYEPVSYYKIAQEMSTPDREITRQAVQQCHDLAVRSLRQRLAHVKPHGTPAQQYAA